jgi:DNA-binding transcriptional regulator YhcF (GntR family)
MGDRPLYLRIADEIAGDIRSGRLAEGQPAPSTRAIVRDWNVAMATATKVIGALRASGLVETIPGSGTVVRRRNEPAAGTTRRARLTQLTEAQAEKDTGMSADEWMRHHDRGLRQQAGSAGHPGLGHVIGEPFDFDLDTVFEYGLQRLLDGIDARRHALNVLSRP